MSFPECVVCSSPFRYKGRQPYLLPCLHAVCSVCFDHELDGVITCSVCQRSHGRSNQSFPVDHVVLAEVLHLTAKHRPSEISCTNKEDGNQAVCLCEECSDFLCEHCQISHGEVKATRVHKLWEMSDLSKTFKTSHSKCIRYGLSENIFDKDCGRFICSQCLFIDHTNHVAITSEESSSLDDNNLKEDVKSVSEKKDEVLQSTAAVDAHVNVLGDASSRLRESVKHTFSELRSLLDQREKVILLELDQLMECMNTTNNSRRPVLKGLETSCQTTVDYMNSCLLYTPPQQLHQLKSSIGEATQFCNNTDVPQVHEKEASVAFSKQGLQDLRTDILSFGSFLASVNEQGHSDEFISFQSVRIKSLETTIESCRKQATETSKKLKTLTEEVSKRGDQIQELEETNRHLQKVVQQVFPDGLCKYSFLHLIPSDDNQVLVVKCPKMTLDENRVNLKMTRIDETGDLVRDNSDRDNTGHLQKYWGTSAGSPLPSSGLVYWEVDADMDITYELSGGKMLFEIAVCDEDVMDTSSFVAKKSNSCSLYVCQSKKYDNIGLRIFENVTNVVTKNNILPNIVRIVRQFKFGVLYDGVAQQVTFIDITDMEVLGRGTLSMKTQSAKLWPMFGLFLATKKIKLVSGADISMSGQKKMLLLKELRSPKR